jgi:hypothetical protein
MKRTCLDEGTLQAYLDGELSHEAAGIAAAHISDCVSCAEALSEATNEMSFLASQFALDADLSVPTSQLRSRIDAAIARLDSPQASESRRTNGWSLSALLAPLSGLFTLTPQRMAALATVAVVVVLVSLVLINRTTVDKNKDLASSGNGPRTKTTPTPETPSGTPAATPEPSESPRPGTPGGGPKRGSNRKKATPFTPVPAPVLKKLDRNFFPDESQYQSTIASLKKTIKAGDSTLKPSVIADYERNIALLDRTIEETRRVAVNRPGDADAENFLRSAYQSKIALMTTVADSTQVATLDR